MMAIKNLNVKTVAITLKNTTRSFIALGTSVILYKIRESAWLKNVLY